MENKTENKKIYHLSKELERQDNVDVLLFEKIDKILDAVNKTNIEIAGLKVKSGIWGAIGGTIPIVIIVLFMIIKGFNNGAG